MTENNFDPNTCSLEELKERINELELTEEYYNTMQLSAKTFINSVYGVFGAEFFNLSNSDIAESITLQGQDLIKFSVIEINDYINNFWNQDYDGHKRIADRMKSIFGDAFKYEEFLERAKNNTIKLDTVQVYGDSVVGDSNISLGDGSKIKIETLFDEGYESETDITGKTRVKSNRTVLCMNLENGILCEKTIKYVMRHKVNKKLFKVYNENNGIICTEDHSLIGVVENKTVQIKPATLLDDNYLFVLNERTDGINRVNQFITEIVENNDYEYVYDIEVDADSDNYHNFFANNILVHNTDSVSSDTIVYTYNHQEGISIEDFYLENDNQKTVEVVTDDGDIYKIKYNDDILVKRDGLETKIKAFELKDTDEIYIK